jgi:dimeric dUTPase (all-alpha-NTP-PPase superfamily)
MKYATPEQLVEMLELQEVLNKKYNGEKWRKAFSIGMAKSAMLVEVAEMLDEIQASWGWWKKNPRPTDVIAAHFEFIDVIHFAMLLLLYHNDVEDVVRIIKDDSPNYDSDMAGPVGDPHDAFITAITRFMTGIRMELRHTAIVNFKNIIETGSLLLGMYPGDVYKAYRIKNEINHKRVDNGETNKGQ